MKKEYAPAYKHEPIEALFDDVFWVHGSIKIGPGMYMNRNMVIIKNEDDLYLVNPIRLSEEEERKLCAMGTIKAIIRLGDFHGIDDQYYLDTYACDFWCQKGQTTYPVTEYDQVINSECSPPFKDAEFFIFSKASCPEAALYLSKQKLLITTDSIQYWADWQHMNTSAKWVLWLMGFRKGLFIGKPWMKRVSPNKQDLWQDFENLLKLDFDHLLAAHGKPFMGNARNAVVKIVDQTFQP